MYQKYNDMKSKITEIKRLIDIQLSNLADTSSVSTGKSTALEFLSSNKDHNRTMQTLPLYESKDTTRSQEQEALMRQLHTLNEEKKHLHAYLKVYEKDFNTTHNRSVMKQEDILPVANEYQRYKELKQIISDVKQKLGIT